MRCSALAAPSLPLLFFEQQLRKFLQGAGQFFRICELVQDRHGGLAEDIVEAGLEFGKEPVKNGYDLPLTLLMDWTMPVLSLDRVFIWAISSSGTEDFAESSESQDIGYDNGIATVILGLSDVHVPMPSV